MLPPKSRAIYSAQISSSTVASAQAVQLKVSSEKNSPVSQRHSEAHWATGQLLSSRTISKPHPASHFGSTAAGHAVHNFVASLKYSTLVQSSGLSTASPQPAKATHARSTRSPRTSGAAWPTREPRVGIDSRSTPDF